jgi:hypothetical protein
MFGSTLTENSKERKPPDSRVLNARQPIIEKPGPYYFIGVGPPKKIKLHLPIE